MKNNPFHALRLAALAVLAILLPFTAARAQMAVRIDVANSPELIAAFATADANPLNFYSIYLVWRKNADGTAIKWVPTQTIKLTKGYVSILGSTSHNYPERYIFDGDGKRTLFDVTAAAGFNPTLSLDGITIQNCYSTGGQGGAIRVGKAKSIAIYNCVIKNNKSNLNGSGIFVGQTQAFTMGHTLVDGNTNDQINDCGGGQTSGGGGMTLTSTPYVTIYNSTISNNKSCRGGGMEIGTVTTLRMTNTTISNNEAKRRGGGILFNGGTANATFRFNTVAYNKAGTANSIIETEKNYAGGIGFGSFNGHVDMYGNIVAKNTIQNQSPNLIYKTNDFYNDGGSWRGNYNGGNILGNLANCIQWGSPIEWGHGSDGREFDPKLTSFLSAKASNTGYGFALTMHPPLSDSPARGNFFPEATGAKYCEQDDQRSFYRRGQTRGRCDIGAVEFDSFATPQ